MASLTAISKPLLTLRLHASDYSGLFEQCYNYNNDFIGFLADLITLVLQIDLQIETDEHEDRQTDLHMHIDRQTDRQTAGRFHR
jgi:hypothetical protein